MCSKKALIGTVWYCWSPLGTPGWLLNPGFDPGFDSGFVLKKGHKKGMMCSKKALVCTVWCRWASLGAPGWVLTWVATGGC